MGKKAKIEVRGRGGQTMYVKKKSSKRAEQAIEDTVSKGLQGVSIFSQLNNSNAAGMERQLMALSAVSLGEDMPIHLFYEPRKSSAIRPPSSLTTSRVRC